MRGIFVLFMTRVIECAHGGHIGKRNNTMMSLWEINYILMQISYFVWLFQHGRPENTLLELKKKKRKKIGGNHAFFRHN